MCVGFALFGFMSFDTQKLWRQGQVGFHVKRAATEKEGANSVMNLFFEGFE